MSEQKRSFLVFFPGILLALAVAVPSLWLNMLYPPISAVAIAIIIGLLTRNLFGMPKVCGAGNAFIVKRILRLAIILLGARLSFFEVLKAGGNALLIITCCLILALLLVQFITRLLRLPPRLGTLIGVGTAICGNSAIVATAPAIKAKDEEVAFAVSTITLFGVMAVFAYPLIGHWLKMTDTCFGTWAGTAINDTSQVVTAGFIFSDEAGNIATVVKLTRNLFMAPVIVLMSILYNRGNANTDGGHSIDYKKTFPLFVLGFVGMAVLRTLSVFPAEVIDALKTISDFLIVMSIAAVGLETSFAAMKKVGLKPFYVGFAASVIMGGVSFVLIKVLGIG